MTTPIVEHADVRAAIDLLDAWIEAQRVYRELPGLSLGIVHDQALVWARGVGWADVDRRAPATADTLFRIGSITKLFTATAILILRDAGKLQLDDPLSAHLPWFEMKTAFTEAGPLTIRHLLSHTAGLPREAAFPYWTDGQFPTIDEIRARVRTQERPLPTEDRWKYSNLGATLAGEVVAAVAGEPYRDFVQRNLLAPLGMTVTLVDTPQENHPGLATGYTRWLPRRPRQPLPVTDLRGLSAAGNMTTSVTDLARFAMLQLRGGAAGGAQVLAGRTLGEMQRVHWLEPEWQAGWGLGFRVLRIRNKTFVGHAGGIPGFRSELRICPADKVAAIVFVNADDGETSAYVDKALEWVGSAIADATKPTPPAADPDWQRYVGRYRNRWGDLQIIVRGGELTVIGPLAPDPLLAPSTLKKTGEHVFRLETRDGYGIPGELVVFEVDAAGRVRRARFGENYAARIESWDDPA
ncbi:MAG TPA: serine hydrolase [Patescibacteria group bacterium]|nr:serine hydrolase [Patescibacteria group bacterium]